MKYHDLLSLKKYLKLLSATNFAWRFRVNWHGGCVNLTQDRVTDLSRVL